MSLKIAKYAFIVRTPNHVFPASFSRHDTYAEALQEARDFTLRLHELDGSDSSCAIALIQGGIMCVDGKHEERAADGWYFDPDFTMYLPRVLRVTPSLDKYVS